MRDRRHGVVYTPKWLAEQTVEWALAGAVRVPATVAVPACGEGVFIESVARHLKGRLGAESTQIEGFDTNRGACERARERLRVGVRAEVHQRCWLREARTRPGHWDLIVGNPPYVRWQNMSPQERRAVREAGVEARGASDLYLAFIESALDALAGGGRLAFVTPGSWLWSKAARGTRARVHGQHTLERVVDFEHLHVFKGTAAHVVVSVIAKRRSSPGHRAAGHTGEVGRGANAPRKGWIDTAQAQWRAMDDATRAALAHERGRGRALGEVAAIRIGAQSLADEVYVLEALGNAGSGRTRCATLKGPRRETEIETGLIRPVIKAGRAREGRRRVILYPYEGDAAAPLDEGVLRARFPWGMRWLDAHRARLDRRSKAGSGPWYGYARASTARGMFKRQAVTARISLRPNFEPIDDETTGYYGGYGVRPHDPARLGALTEQLNSARMRRWIEAGSRQFGQGWYDYSKQFIESFPILEESG